LGPRGGCRAQPFSLPPFSSPGPSWAWPFHVTWESPAALPARAAGADFKATAQPDLIAEAWRFPFHPLPPPQIPRSPAQPARASLCRPREGQPQLLQLCVLGQLLPVSGSPPPSWQALPGVFGLLRYKHGIWAHLTTSWSHSLQPMGDPCHCLPPWASAP
jgi:hypothetical protein